VFNRNALSVQASSDQQAPMAFKRVMLRAHQGYPVLLSTIDDTLQAALEIRRLSHPLIVSHAVAEEVLILGTPPQFFAEKNIGNLVHPQLIPKRVTVKLRIST